MNSRYTHRHDIDPKPINLGFIRSNQIDSNAQLLLSLVS